MLISIIVVEIISVTNVLMIILEIIDMKFALGWSHSDLGSSLFRFSCKGKVEINKSG